MSSPNSSSSSNTNAGHLRAASAGDSPVLVDIYFQVGEEKIGVILDMDKCAACRFSVLVRGLLDNGFSTVSNASSANAQVYVTSYSVLSLSSADQNKLRKEVIVLESTPRAFPGAPAFQTLATWMLANSSAPSNNQRGLAQLMPAEGFDAPLRVLVNIYAAANMLQLPDVKWTLRRAIYDALTYQPAYLNANDIKYIFDKLGDQEGVIRRMVNSYWNHVFLEQIPRRDAQLEALLEAEPILGEEFDRIKKLRIARKIEKKLREGDVFPEDVEYLIL